LAFLFFSRLPWAIILGILSITLIFTLGATIIYSVRRNSTTIIKNFLYFILYICALEIAPYVLLYQAAMT
jgi:ABC-type dipeptide/oligopeptide/nickel transport system permease component